MDNSKDRLVDVFFYGLYMDEEILKSKNVNPRNKRAAIAPGYHLRVGKMATLLRDNNAQAFGMVYSLTHDEITSLYEGSGLTAYVPESIVIQTKENQNIAALCCNLLNPPSDDEKNEEYLEKLTTCMEKYNLPTPHNS